MATTNPNNDSQLNRVDLSLHEFLGAPWKNSATSKSNPVALEMLLVAQDDTGEPTTHEGKTTDGETPLIRRRQHPVPTSTPEVARETALQKREYITVAKLTYPSVWHKIRTSQTVLGAGLQRTQYTLKVVSRTMYLTKDLIWLLLTPVHSPFQRLFDVLVGDEYARAVSAFKSRVHRNRLWLGRSRGYNYFSAFYYRCQYLVSYFQVRQFYEIELFLKNNVTIRRAIQAILPIGLFGSVMCKAALITNVVDTRGTHSLQNTTKRLFTKESESGLLQLFTADETYPLDLDTELNRLESGVLVTNESHLVTEFVAGAYAEVEKVKLDEVIHPNELAQSLEMHHIVPAHTYTSLKLEPTTRIGQYELSLAEEDEIPDPEPVAPGEEEKDEETKLAEIAEIRASFVPESRYTVLREDDDIMLEAYTTSAKGQKYRTHKQQRRAYQQQPKRQPYVEAMPYGPLMRKAAAKPKSKYTNEELRTYMQELPLTHRESDNIPWIDELLRAPRIAATLFPQLNFEAWDARIASLFATSEQQMNAQLSPFGVTIDVHNTDATRRTANKETKIFPYAFKDSAALLEALGVGTPETLTHEAIKYVFQGLDEPDEYAKAASELSLIRADDADLDLDDDEDDDEMLDADTSLQEQEILNENLFADEEEDDDENGNEDDELDDWEDANNTHMVDEDATFETWEDEELVSDDEQPGFKLPLGQSEPIPLVQPQITLFVNPTVETPFKSMVWKHMAFPLLMYASLEFCIRLECQGIRVRLKRLPTVHRLIPHLGRLQEAVPAREYVGETMETVQVRKLLLAFQARRGTELYGHSQWTKLWTLVIRPNISANQAVWLSTKKREWKEKLSQVLTGSRVQEEPVVLIARNVSQYSGLPKTKTFDITPRYFGFNKVTETIYQYTHTKNSDGSPLSAAHLAERQQQVNQVGGETTITRALEYGKAVQEEICHFPLFALIKPGMYRMNRLPKGLILLGDPGNGRTYFVRTLATESRLPLLITESNRYLDQSLGLVRLKTLFKRVRDQAPNILFIRDMDFMTRHRERYPTFTSVRATTQLLMAIDGYSRGTETIPSEQDIFVIGSMTTTKMMDEACMRSGRFEWVLNFYYPPVKERQNMFLLHSTKSIVNTTLNVDWNYFTAMTEGFSCLDIRTIVNSSAVYALRQNSTLHTSESVASALGAVNHIHDLPEVTFNSAGSLSFFLNADYRHRENNIASYAPFFTQTGHVPMYKKLMHVFKAMLPKDMERITTQWEMSQQNTHVSSAPISDRTVVNGLLPLLCEGVFLYNTQKMCGTPYPMVTFDTYCSPLFGEMKNMLDEISFDHTVERITKDHLFITTFDLWRRSHPNTWMPTGLFDSKSITMRTNATSLWRSTRLAKKFSVIGGLTELEGEILWGPPTIATKIKNRMIFIGENTPEFASRDAVLFGTFETHSDLAFKCRKNTTARRVKQVSMEILDVMQKHWR